MSVWATLSPGVTSKDLGPMPEFLASAAELISVSLKLLAWFGPKEQC